MKHLMISSSLCLIYSILIATLQVLIKNGGKIKSDITTIFVLVLCKIVVVTWILITLINIIWCQFYHVKDVTLYLIDIKIQTFFQQ